MKKELLMEGWHLDKRVSVSHIFTTLSAVIVVLIAWFTLESRVTIAEVKIRTIEGNDTAIRNEVQNLGTSILNKLDTMEVRRDEQMGELRSQQYEHIKEHSNTGTQ